MRTLGDRDSLMAGIYRIRFPTAAAADAFISRYADCPVCPFVREGPIESEVAVLSLELRAQQHGDLYGSIKHARPKPRPPRCRGDQLSPRDPPLALFSDHEIRTGRAEVPPCASVC